MISSSIVVLCVLLTFSTVDASDTVRFRGADMLKYLNYYRCMHGTPPLTYDNALAASAQEWAYNRQNNACAMQHSGYPSLGECVAAGTWRGLTGYNYWDSDVAVVSGWYHEPWTYGSSSIQYNHFSQLVWSGTTRVGCAWAPCASAAWEFWVCQFTPTGNILNATIINNNVPKPCRTEAQCRFVLQNMNLTAKWTTDPEVSLQPNQIDAASYNYGAQTCRTPVSAYTPYTGPVCKSDSSGALARTIDVSITNPSSTGPANAKINCPVGQPLSGTGAVTCTSANAWSIAGSCGGSAATSPPASTTTGCWGSLLRNVYLFQYPAGYSGRTTSTLAQAQAECLTLPACGGITQTSSGWECRAGTTPYTSPSGENSILRINPCSAGNVVMADVTFQVGSDLYYSENASAFLMTPNIRNIQLKLSPEGSDSNGATPSGTVTLLDNMLGNPTTSTSGRLDAHGHVEFDMNYGLKKTGLHLITAQYNGDSQFNPRNFSFPLLYFANPTKADGAKFVISNPNPAISPASVYLYGRQWNVANGQNLTNNFYGLLINEMESDTSMEYCSENASLISGSTPDNDGSYGVGQYMAAYVINPLISRQNGFRGTIQSVAVVRLNPEIVAAGQKAEIDLETPVLGQVVANYCPPAGSV